MSNEGSSLGRVNYPLNVAAGGVSLRVSRRVTDIKSQSQIPGWDEEKDVAS